MFQAQSYFCSLCLAFGLVSFAAAQTQNQPAAPSGKLPALRVYFGTYTGRGSKGIYVGRLNRDTGALTVEGLAGEVENPSFVAVHPSRKFLYAAGEIGRFAGRPSGAVSAFAIDPATGKLQLLNQQPSGGGGPCHLSVDAAGQNVLVANYGGGSVAVLPIGADGRLSAPSCEIQHRGSGPDKRRQEGPHAHSINLDAANRFAFAADLGLDKLMVYRFDGKEGRLTPNEPPFASSAPGAGPRHFDFHPTGKFAYLINEMASTVTAFTYDAQAGKLQAFQTVGTLPQDFQGNNTTADIHVHPSGKFLYGSNRGHDSIAVFSLDPSSGKLTLVQHQSTQGKTPRNFGIDPSGTFLLAANQDSHNVVVLRIDPATGRLSPTGQEAKVSMPVCVKMVPLD